MKAQGREAQTSKEERFFFRNPDGTRSKHSKQRDVARRQARRAKSQS